MNKTELIAAAAEGAGLTKKDTERVINAAIDAVTAALVKGDKVQVSGFGTFETKEREAPHQGSHRDPRYPRSRLQGKQGSEGRRCKVSDAA